jgi:hypothetical protein
MAVDGEPHLPEAFGRWCGCVDTGHRGRAEITLDLEIGRQHERVLRLVVHVRRAGRHAGFVGDGAHRRRN